MKAILKAINIMPLFVMVQTMTHLLNGISISLHPYHYERGIDRAILVLDGMFMAFGASFTVYIEVPY